MTDLGVDEKYAILNLLISGKNTDQVATVVGCDRQAVRDFAMEHGFPRREVMAGHRAFYASKITPAKPDDQTKVIRLSKVADPITDLLQDAKDYPARIARKAERIEQLVSELRKEMLEHKQENEERLRKERQAEQIKRQMADLQKQLRALGLEPKKKRGPKPNNGTMVRRHAEQRDFLAQHNITFTELRTWAETHGYGPIKSSLVSKDILQAYADSEAVSA